MANWVVPESGYVKLNVKGFVGDYGKAGHFAYVIRDDQGQWIGGCGGRLDVSCRDHREAELMAMWFGLRYCWSLDLPWVQVECEDNAAVVDIDAPLTDQSTLMVALRQVVLRGWSDLKFAAIGVSQNKLARNMARFARLMK